jgi:adenylate kinase family enzyme
MAPRQAVVNWMRDEYTPIALTNCIKCYMSGLFHVYERHAGLIEEEEEEEEEDEEEDLEPWHRAAREGTTLGTMRGRRGLEKQQRRRRAERRKRSPSLSRLEDHRRFKRHQPAEDEKEDELEHGQLPPVLEKPPEWSAEPMELFDSPPVSAEPMEQDDDDVELFDSPPVSAEPMEQDDDDVHLFDSEGGGKKSKSWKPLVFHVTGMSGSGKSFIGRKLKESSKKDSFIVLDTDDILSDAHHQVKGWKDLFKKGKHSIYLGRRAKNEDRILKNAMKRARKEKKHLVVVGFAIPLGPMRGRPTPNHTYMIDVDPKVSFKRRLGREMKKITKMQQSINKAIKDESSVIIDEILFHEPYGLRGCFPGWWQRYESGYKDMKHDFKEMGHKVMKSNAIVKDILGFV